MSKSKPKPDSAAASPPASPPLDEARRLLLAAALRHAPFEGWNERGLRRAARDAGLSETTMRRAFPRGAVDVVGYFLDTINQRLEQELAKADLKSMKIRQKVALGVRTHLTLVEDYREAVRRSLSWLALPGMRRRKLALGSLYDTVDIIWRAAGDTATDFNFYTKRGLLAGVYASTLIHWLGDETPGHEASWAFLDRRIDDVMQIQKVRGRIEGLLGRLPIGPWRRTAPA